MDENRYRYIVNVFNRKLVEQAGSHTIIMGPGASGTAVDTALGYVRTYKTAFGIWRDQRGFGQFELIAIVVGTDVFWKDGVK